MRAYVILGDYRTSDLPSGYLDSMRARFAAARTAGIKLLPRYAYDLYSTNGAPLSWVLRHIEQLADVWADYSDAILALQAGFIGRWGEWGSSANNLDTPANKATIVAALLDALPASRMIQLRTPYHYVHGNGLTYDIGSSTCGEPPSSVTVPFDACQLAEADRFTGSNLSRMGHKNDVVL